MEAWGRIRRVLISIFSQGNGAAAPPWMSPGMQRGLVPSHIAIWGLIVDSATIPGDPK